MSFDRNWPQFGDQLTSLRLRGQWNGLDEKIDAIPAGPPGPPGPPFAQAVVDTVSTVGPDDPASVGVLFDGSNVRFSFGIPRGHDGANGGKGDKGDGGEKGDKGDTGETGPPFASVIVDSVTTLGPDEPATASVSFDGANVHLSLGIPRGHDGGQGEQGQPGEVSNQQLSDGLAAVTANSSANTNSVELIDTSAFEDPPTLANLLTVANMYNEMLLAQRR
ncbi:MAG TPA: hypothetical protein VI454_12695 [Verrucomicrobiae bacterium]|jgi:hypothetical protein